MDIDGMYLIFFLFFSMFRLKHDFLGVKEILINCNKGAKVLSISVAANWFLISHFSLFIFVICKNRHR